ncbi:hypothetical protein NFI96_009142, partial [Prochilodus magdalenae]
MGNGVREIGGIHTWQKIEGCELQDDGTKKGFMQFGYDGEDWLILDLNTVTWTAAHHKAVPVKLKWERAGAAQHAKNYLENDCIEYLQKYVDYGREALERKVPPEVSLFQKDSSSPVVCHATGFFPKAVMISWKKNGEDLHEDVELRETLPNQDRTFQKRSILTVPPEELDSGKYTCVIHHKGLEKEIVLLVSDRRVLSGGGTNGIIIGVVVAVLLLVVIGCVGFFVWKKKPGMRTALSLLYGGVCPLAAVKPGFITWHIGEGRIEGLVELQAVRFSDGEDWYQDRVHACVLKVSLFQKDSSSPVVCHATGFFPKAVMISWKKNGEDVHEDVELRETLPNQDGTFQRRSILTLCHLRSWDNGKYTCIIQHGGLEKEIVLQVSDRRVLSGGGMVGVIIGVVLAVLLLVVIGCVGLFIWKKKSGMRT